MFKFRSSRGTLPMQWMMASTIPWCRGLLVWVLGKMHRMVDITKKSKQKIKKKRKNT